jgi:lysyl endopeptidase
MLIFYGSLSCRLLEAQIQHPGHPMPVQYKGSKTIPFTDLSIQIASKAARVDSETKISRHKNEEFAYSVEVRYDFHNAGIWDTLENGWKIWRMGIRSEGANSLNLIFTGYKLERGVRIYLYDPEQYHVLGAYTHDNNKPFEMLAIEPVPGDQIIVEMQVPSFIENPGKLTIGMVGHAYKGGDGDSRVKDGWYGLSGPCNPDIRCYEDSLRSLLKHSVVRIVYDGKERCTGTLLANTLNDSRPYVLTAGHCIRTELLANTAVFFFDYESPYCNGPDGRNHQSISGGTLKARANDDLNPKEENHLDFSLIELSEKIPFYYHPYYAGWDVTGSATNGALSIHHPQGDVKKIAIDDDIQTTGNFGEGFDAGTHWVVGDWETGTTEKGSSGCALFNNMGRVIGDLSGGDASCEFSMNDYFQKLSHSWADYPDSSWQLKYWLDPLKSSLETKDGFDPYGAFWQTGDTLSNTGAGEPKDLSDKGLSWGYISGHNSDSVKIIAERFIVSGRKYLLGFNINVARAFATSDSASIKIAVWKGLGLHTNPVIEETIPIVDFVAGSAAFLEFDSVLAVQDTFLLGFELFYGSTQDTFAVYHILQEVNENNTAYIEQNGSWKPMSDPVVYDLAVSLAIQPVIYDSLPSGPGNEPPDVIGGFIIYPNPARGGTWISFKESLQGEVSVKLFDLTGRLVYDKKYQQVNNPFYISIDLPAEGIFLLQVSNGQQIANQKLFLIK